MLNFGKHNSNYCNSRCTHLNAFSSFIPSIIKSFRVQLYIIRYLVLFDDVAALLDVITTLRNISLFALACGNYTSLPVSFFIQLLLYLHKFSFYFITFAAIFTCPVKQKLNGKGFRFERAMHRHFVQFKMEDLLAFSVHGFCHFLFRDKCVMHLIGGNGKGTQALAFYSGTGEVQSTKKHS